MSNEEVGFGIDLYFASIGITDFPYGKNWHHFSQRFQRFGTTFNE